MNENNFYDFRDAVKESEKIVGKEGILIDNADIVWSIQKLVKKQDITTGGKAYWLVGSDGRIGYTRNGGRNIRWDYFPTVTV